MIKLVLFAACEKLIIGEDSNSSLIAVLEHVQINGQLTGDLPSNAGIPFKWTAVALWHRTESVPEPVKMSSKYELVNPSKQVYAAAAAEFEVSDKYYNFRNTAHFPLFPIAEEGTYWLQLSYKRSDEDDAKYQLVGEYPIRLIHSIEVPNGEAIAVETNTEKAI